MRSEDDYDLATGAGLIACPRCDALHREVDLHPGERLRCLRCNTTLAHPRVGSFSQAIALAVTSVVLTSAAMFFPFLEISRLGFGNATSLFGVALAFSHGFMLPLTIAVLGMVVGLPILRALLLLYVLVPLSLGRPPARRAAHAFRLSEELRPWSMAEIFIIGTAVAMVKLAGMANVSLGPAFWAFCGLILVGAASRVYTSVTTIWDALEDEGQTSDARKAALMAQNVEATPSPAGPPA